MAGRFDDWTKSVTSEREAVDALEYEIRAHLELEEALDRLLVKLDVLDRALQKQQGKDRTWFIDKMWEDWGKSGRAERIDTWIDQQVGVNRGKVIGQLTKIGVQNNHNHYHYSDVDAETKKGERSYLERLRDDCRKLSLYQLVKEDAKGYKPVTLERIFIELNAHAHVEEGLEEQISSRRHNIPPEPVTEIVRSEKKIVLLGDPGSGKSSWVQNLFANLADSHLNEDVYAMIPEAADLLPVCVVLRDLAAGLDDDQWAEARDKDLWLVSKLFGYVLKTSSEMMFEDTSFEPGLRETLTSGKVFFVFDGLDEVHLDQRKRVRELVEAVVESLAHSFLIANHRK